jgi:subtilisin family serine protease
VVVVIAEEGYKPSCPGDNI